MRAKYYTRFLLRSAEPGFADEYSGVVELSHAVNQVLEPHEIEAELRIYQNDEIIVREPEPDTIAHIMDTIIVFDKIIERMKAEDS